MKLFVYEHITSGALAGQDLPDSLAEAGDLMLMAILQDLASQAQLELIILRDSRLSQIRPLPDVNHCEILWVHDEEGFIPQWEIALTQADTAFVIAPETDSQLEKTQQTIVDAGSSYLGCAQTITKLCSDKLQCFAHLSHSNISTPTTKLASQWLISQLEESEAIVIKPIDGAGCENTQFFKNKEQAQNYLQQTSASNFPSLIVQSYIEGIAASLSLFISDTTVTVLSINRQLISKQQSQLVFKGSEVNTIPTDEFSTRDAQEYAAEIYKAFPGLWGFVGIDFVISSAGPVLIEINPRLTTSYIGLKSLLNFNPTDLLIEHMEEKIKQGSAVYD